MLSDLYAQKRRLYGGFDTDQTFAATDGNTTITADIAGKTQHVQSIIVSISTSAAQVITFQDSAGLWVQQIPANPGVGTRWVFDFGPKGKVLGAGKGLVMAMTAGNAGHVQVLGYKV